jgi:hypothetical protein
MYGNYKNVPFFGYVSVGSWIRHTEWFTVNPRLKIVCNQSVALPYRWWGRVRGGRVRAVAAWRAAPAPGRTRHWSPRPPARPSSAGTSSSLRNKNLWLQAVFWIREILVRIVDPHDLKLDPDPDLALFLIPDLDPDPNQEFWWPKM